MNVHYAKFQKKFESRTISRELPQLRNVSKEIFIARKTESAVFLESIFGKRSFGKSELPLSKRLKYLVFSTTTRNEF